MMATNIIFRPDSHQDLTEALAQHCSLRYGYDASTMDLQQILSTIGLYTFINKATGDYVVDRLGKFAPSQLTTYGGLKSLTKYASSDDEQAPYLEFMDDDGTPCERWVLTDGAWQLHTPVTQWVPQERYIHHFD